MKTFKKTIAVVLCVIMMLGIAPLNGLAEIDLPELHLPSLSLHLPKIDFKLPEIHLNLPKISLPDFSSTFATKANADGETSGTCGENLTWEYDSASQTLTISGTGNMNDYSIDGFDGETAPWSQYCDTMTTIVIDNGVTSIGVDAFYGCNKATSVTIPNSVTGIGWSAFNGCSGLTNVTIPDSVTSIDGFAFSGCTDLTSVTISESVTKIGSKAFYD